MSADPAPSSRAAFFDHDQPRLRSPRRPAPDWGGDDLFDHVPRRRFARGGESAGAGLRHGAAEVQETGGPARRGAEVEEQGGRAHAEVEEQGGRVHAEVEQQGRPLQGRAGAADRAAMAVAEPRSVAELPASAGRRTVTITGRPGELALARGDRGPRTVGQRIGARPDRIAAWACVLGVLLICLALLT